LWLRRKKTDGFRVLKQNFFAERVKVQKRTAEYRITNNERRRKKQEI
jgi:hypothetical protein